MKNICLVYASAIYFLSSCNMPDTHSKLDEAKSASVNMGQPAATNTKRINIESWGKYEDMAAYSRAVKVGNMVFVSGTTATIPGGHVGDNDAYLQSVQTFKNIEWALKKAGASMNDVVRTRFYIVNIKENADKVRKARREFLANIKPTAAMVEVSALADDWMLIEIEVDAIIGAHPDSTIKYHPE